MSYILEYAKSSKSACKGPVKSCPASDRHIEKGELRLGVEVENVHGCVWRHWSCTTPKVFENILEKLSEPSDFKGWEDLREEDRERVQRAWENGKIAEDELPEPAKEHTDPRAKKRGALDLPATAEDAAAESSNKKSKTSAKDKNKEDTVEKEESKGKKTTKAATKKETTKEEEVVKKEEDTAEDEPKQETVIKKGRKKAAEEPKVAPYASKKAASKKPTTEPTRRSPRISKKD